jgi:NAD(P) transhydrogenase
VTDYDVDLLVIGSGPGGQKAAIAASKLGRSVAVVERRHMLGGVCINTGTIPSKTLREAVLYLTGMNMRDLYGQSYRVKDEITIQDLLSHTQHVIGREVEIVRSQLARNHVRLIPAPPGSWTRTRSRSADTAATTTSASPQRRSSSAPERDRPARPRSISTGSGSSTPTASSGWSASRRAWSSSVPA